MFDYNKKEKSNVHIIISVLIHLIIFSLLIFLPDTRELPKEEITNVVIPEPLKKKIVYPQVKKPKKKINVLKKKPPLKKPKKTVKKKKETPKPEIKPQKKNNFSLVKKEKKNNPLFQKKPPPPPQPKKKKLVKVKPPLKKTNKIIVSKEEPKGPVRGKDNLPPGEPGKGGKYLYKGISKQKPKKKSNFVIPFGGKHRFSFKPGEGIGGGSGWKNYGASASFDTHGINLDPWIKEVIRKVKRNWIIPTAAKYGLQGYNAFYLVFNKDGTLGEFKVLIQSKVLSFNLSSKNAIIGSVPFPPIPDYYPYKTVKARFFFYYNIYPEGY